MEGIRYLLYITFGIIFAIFLGLAKDEIALYLPGFTKKLLNSAIDHSPADLRERHRAEWTSHIEKFHGKLIPFFLALGFFILIRLFDTKNPEMRPDWRFRFIVHLSFIFTIFYIPVKLFGVDESFLNVFGISFILTIALTMGHYDGYTRAERKKKEKDKIKINE